MRREVQVHFENCGQLAWHEEIEDVKGWLRQTIAQPNVVAYDKDSGRHFFFDMKRVTAIVIVNKIIEGEKDLYRRTYAAQEGEVTEGDKF